MQSQSPDDPLGVWLPPPSQIRQPSSASFYGTSANEASATGNTASRHRPLCEDPGRDDAALYVLAMPEAGPALKWIATVPITTPGRAFAWDPRDQTVPYTLSKQGREVIVGRLESASISDEKPH